MLPFLRQDATFILFVFEATRLPDTFRKIFTQLLLKLLKLYCAPVLPVFTVFRFLLLSICFHFVFCFCTLFRIIFSCFIFILLSLCPVLPCFSSSGSSSDSFGFLLPSMLFLFLAFALHFLYCSSLFHL